MTVDECMRGEKVVGLVRRFERWPASSRQCFALDKWSLCRLIL
jgi:hypothetical protein